MIQCVGVDEIKKIYFFLPEVLRCVGDVDKHMFVSTTTFVGISSNQMQLKYFISTSEIYLRFGKDANMLAISSNCTLSRYNLVVVGL